tara:strand:- start:167 stop:373 length:207 start_codon:yes stop_codon:yes gene_type:complete
MSANNILKIKTTRFPKHVHDLDPIRYKEMKNKILKIEKAKKEEEEKKKKKNKRGSGKKRKNKLKIKYA